MTKSISIIHLITLAIQYIRYGITLILRKSQLDHEYTLKLSHMCIMLRDILGLEVRFICT